MSTIDASVLQSDITARFGAFIPDVTSPGAVKFEAAVAGAVANYVELRIAELETEVINPLSARIDALELQVAALETGIATLEAGFALFGQQLATQQASLTAQQNTINAQQATISQQQTALAATQTAVNNLPKTAAPTASIAPVIVIPTKPLAGATSSVAPPALVPAGTDIFVVPVTKPKTFA